MNVSNRVEILDELTRLATSEKTPAATPDWIGDEVGPLQMRRLTLPLAIDGVVQSALTLVMLGPRSVPDGHPFWDMRAVLTAAIGTSVYHLARLEFDPPGPGPHHTNRPPGRKGRYPANVTGPHLHPFAENAQIGLQNLQPSANLPIALPENSEFRHYEQVMEIVRSRFVIPEFWTEDPKWLLSLV